MKSIGFRKGQNNDMSTWRTELGNRYRELGPKSFLPKELSEKLLNDFLSIVRKFEAGTVSLEEAEHLGFAALALKSVLLELSKPLTDQLDQKELHSIMNTYADELILESYRRKNLIKLVSCTEPEKFYSATRPTVVQIINDDDWPVSEIHVREQLRNMAVDVKFTEDGDVELIKL